MVRPAQRADACDHDYSASGTFCVTTSTAPLTPESTAVFATVWIAPATGEPSGLTPSLPSVPSTAFCAAPLTASVAWSLAASTAELTASLATLFALSLSLSKNPNPCLLFPVLGQPTVVSAPAAVQITRINWPNSAAQTIPATASGMPLHCHNIPSLPVAVIRRENSKPCLLRHIWFSATASNTGDSSAGLAM